MAIDVSVTQLVVYIICLYVRIDVHDSSLSLSGGTVQR